MKRRIASPPGLCLALAAAGLLVAPSGCTKNEKPLDQVDKPATNAYDTASGPLANTSRWAAVSVVWDRDDLKYDGAPTGTFTFDNANPRDKITCSGCTFASDDYPTNAKVRVVGTTNSDGLYTIFSRTDTALTLTDGNAFSSDETSSATLYVETARMAEKRMHLCTGVIDDIKQRSNGAMAARALIPAHCIYDPTVEGNRNIRGAEVAVIDGHENRWNCVAGWTYPSWRPRKGGERQVFDLAVLLCYAKPSDTNTCRGTVPGTTPDTTECPLPTKGNPANEQNNSNYDKMIVTEGQSGCRNLGGGVCAAYSQEWHRRRLQVRVTTDTPSYTDLFVYRIKREGPNNTTDTGQCDSLGQSACKEAGDCRWRAAFSDCVHDPKSNNICGQDSGQPIFLQSTNKLLGLGVQTWSESCLPPEKWDGGGTASCQHDWQCQSFNCNDTTNTCDIADPYIEGTNINYYTSWLAETAQSLPSGRLPPSLYGPERIMVKDGQKVQVLFHSESADGAVDPMDITGAGTTPSDCSGGGHNWDLEATDTGSAEKHNYRFTIKCQHQGQGDIEYVRDLQTAYKNTTEYSAAWRVRISVVPSNSKVHLVGDSNKDGVINETDVEEIHDYIRTRETAEQDFNPTCEAALDVDGDGDIDRADADLLHDYVHYGSLDSTSPVSICRSTLPGSLSCNGNDWKRCVQ